MNLITKHDLSYNINYNFNPTFWDLLQNGLWEPNLFKIFDRFLDAKYAYIDFGGWIGPSVLYGVQRAKYCHTIEPDPVAFAELEKNILLNPQFAHKISLYKECIADKEKLVYLEKIGCWASSGTHIIENPNPNTIPSHSITLEKFIEKYQITDYNFIKMDIEGAEFVVIPTLSKILDQHRPTIHLSFHPAFTTNPFNELEKSYDFITKFDYHFYTNTFLPLDKDAFLKYSSAKAFDIIVSPVKL